MTKKGHEITSDVKNSALGISAGLTSSLTFSTKLVFVNLMSRILSYGLKVLAVN